MSSEIRTGDFVEDQNGNYSLVKNIDYVRNPELYGTGEEHRTHTIIIFDDHKIELEYQKESWVLVPKKSFL